MADMDRISQVEMLDHCRGGGCIMVHVVASGHLRGAAVTAPVVRRRFMFNKTLSLSFTLTSATRPEDGEVLLLAASQVAPSSGESAEKELLDQAGANPFSRSDRKISEDQPDTTIGSGIVKVREG